MASTKSRVERLTGPSLLPSLALGLMIIFFCFRSVSGDDVGITGGGDVFGVQDNLAFTLLGVAGVFCIFGIEFLLSLLVFSHNLRCAATLIGVSSTFGDELAVSGVFGVETDIFFGSGFI